MTVAVAAAQATDVAGQKAMYGSRLENSYAVDQKTALALEAQIGAHLKRDPYYPTAQRLDTTFIRTTGHAGKHGDLKIDKDLKDAKLRVRTYLDAPGEPTFLEHKHKVVGEDGVKIEAKDRMAVPRDTVDRLLAGEQLSDIVGASGRPAAEQELTKFATHVTDELGVQPVIHEQYLRAAFEEGNVRMTIDRGIQQTGIGALDGAGTVFRGPAIFDVKVVGDTPPWVSSLLDAHKGALTLAEHGKGATSLEALMSNLAKHH